jgi:hypothetical protein
MAMLVLGIVVTVLGLWAIYWLLAQIAVVLGSLVLFCGGGWLVTCLLRRKQRSARASAPTRAP